MIPVKSEARPKRIRTARKSFGHVFNEHKGPYFRVEGFGCCMCGFFTKTLGKREKRLVCGYVTYPVMP